MAERGSAGPEGPRSGAGREKRPTMRDVADQVGVSQALVSIVFRGAEGASKATRERVLEAAAEIGYRPDSLAQGLRRNRSRTLGVLFSMRRPFEVELVEHMYPIAHELGHNLLLGPFTPGRGQDAVINEPWVTVAPGSSSSGQTCTRATSSRWPGRWPLSRSVVTSATVSST